MNDKFLITTAIPYVNAKPHVGHALEFVQADVVKRFNQALGKETLLLSGGDENALKNVQAAEDAGIEIQEFVDKNSQLFLNLAQKLNIQFDVFQKGSSSEHHKSAQILWMKCFDNGDIYKKKYTGLYCTGCEAFYEKSELNDVGECFEHPGKRIDEVSEENYFFKLSKYQKEIEKIIEEDEIEIIPNHRKNEILSFIKSGINDISISRSNIRAKNWGVPVPGDESQRMYVWFDALNIYQSGVGFGSYEKQYNKWWPADVHVIGKGILRFHAVYWPAFLLSAKLKLPKKIFVHGYFTVDGQKMSKTLGNVIDPISLIDKYGADALRYYFLAKFSPTNDGDFSEEKFREVYNADLANGLGNLAARVAKLCETLDVKFEKLEESSLEVINEFKIFSDAIKAYRFNDALQALFFRLSDLDKAINDYKPWEKIKTDKKGAELFLITAINIIRKTGIQLQPFLPETAKKIEEQFKGPEIKSAPPLFPRLT